VLALVREAGFDADALAREIGAPSLSARLLPAQAETLLARTLDRIGDPDLGLRLGAVVRPELFGIAGFAAMAAPTFGEALERLARFKRMLWIDQLELETIEEGQRVRAVIAGELHARLRADFELAFVVAFGRMVTDRAELKPRRVELRGTAPAAPRRAKYEALFRCPVEFEQRFDEVIFSRVDLRRPLVSHSPELSTLFNEHAERLLAESGSERASERARAAVRRLLRGEVPGVGEVARALGMSVRSLQRKLTAEGTSFAALLEGTRQEVACELLTHTASDVAEISFMLGFSSPNSFHRAFRRWKRMTPGEYRRRG
jgi:AraC-like DNA-binding protein